MKWEFLSSIAALIAALFGALAWWEARRSVTLQKKSNRERRELQLGRFRESLGVVQQILRNPPRNGFDHAPKPDFRLAELNEILATKGLLSGEKEKSIRDARDALVEVDRLIDETQDSLFAGSVDFRQRFPSISQKALSALSQALKAISPT